MADTMNLVITLRKEVPEREPEKAPAELEAI